MKLEVGKRYLRRSEEKGCLYVQILAKSEDLGLQLTRPEYYGIVIYKDPTDKRIIDRRFFAWYEDGRFISVGRKDDPMDLLSEFEGERLSFRQPKKRKKVTHAKKKK